MGWFSSLFANGVGTVVEQVGDTIDKFHLSGEEKQKFKLEVQRIVADRESEIEQTVRQNLESRERILVAELQQGDSYTKRARPTVVYFGLVMIAINYLIVPIIAMIAGSEEVVNFPLPTEFWAAWGGIVATWAIGRSFEKTGASNRATRAATGSKPTPSLLDDDQAVG